MTEVRRRPTAAWRRRRPWRCPALPGPPCWGPSSPPSSTSSRQPKMVSCVCASVCLRVCLCVPVAESDSCSFSPSSLFWLRLSRPGVGSRGDRQAAGHGTDRRDAHQHGDIHAADVQPHRLLLQCIAASPPAAATQPGGVGPGQGGGA